MDSLLKELSGLLSERVRLLSNRYGFSEDEGRIYLGMDEVEVVIPFCGVILDGCEGLKYNHGLYTQCQKSLFKDGYCKTCNNAVTKSGHPTYGTISDRMKGIALDFRDPKGKQVVPYGNVMNKLNISREMAEATAKKTNQKIPEEEFALKTTQRGRPKKKMNSESSDSSTAKKRGRPRKDKKIVSNMAPGDDLIANLVAMAREDDTEKNTQKADPIESDDEEEIEVVKLPYNGVEYYKDKTSDTIYNKEGEVLGEWNEATQCIDFEE